MPRSVELTFADGRKHVYEGVPDEATPDQVKQRARRDFPGLALTSINRLGDIPTAPTPAQAAQGSREYVAPLAVAPVAAGPGPSLMERIVGTGEAALTTATGMTGGALGMVGGTAGATAAAILDGSFGTAEAAQMIEQAASEGAQALTYAPRTASGQSQAEAVGGVMQQLVPLAGLAPQMAGLTRGAGPAAAATRTAAGAVLDRVNPAARAAAAPEVAGGFADVAQTRPTINVNSAGVAGGAAQMPATALAQTARRAGEGGAGGERAARILAEQAAPDAQKVAAAERLGITEYLQPDHVTTNEAYRQVVAAIKSNPQSQVALAERQGLASVAQRASSLIDEIGGGKDLSALDVDVKSRIQGVAGNMKGQADKLWGELRTLVPDAAPVEAPATRQVIAGMVEALGGEQKAMQAMPAAARRFLAPLMGDEPITHGYLDLTRKQVGQATQKRTGPFADMETGQLKQFYAALTSDQEAVAKATSDSAYYTFRAAKYATQLQKGFEDDLSALFGRDLDRSMVAGGQTGLGGATAALAKGDATRITRLLSSIPEDMRQQVVASGLSTVLRRASVEGGMDFTGYAKWYAGLRENRQAYSAIMSNLPLGAAKQLEALYRVSEGVSTSLNRRVKTGALNTIKAEMMGADSMMEGLYSFARRAAVGVPAEAAATAVGLPGAGISAAIASALTKGKSKPMAAADALIASPEFQQMVSAPAGPAQAAAIRRFAYSPDFTRFARAVGNPRELTNREQWILQMLRPVPIQQQPQQVERIN